MKQKISLLTSFLLAVCFMAFAQTPASVKGVVKDSTGNPISGVTVRVVGTGQGIVTNTQGEYQLRPASAQATLEFSFVGYETQLIPMNGRTQIDLVMLQSTSSLGEAVVVIGYGAQRKKDLTGSVSVISAADIANRPIVNAGEALQGKAAGVQVTSVSGKPGAVLSIRVRGSSSISAGNEPLYVVDGIPMTDIAAFSPNDIESVSVLKDAASTAIYGTRAANGVVVITTKKGKKGQSRIDFTSYFGTSTPTRKLHMLNAKQYQEYANETLGAGTVTDAMVQANDINWQDEVFRTGTQQNYQLALSGGNDKTQHYISLGYTNQKGMVKPATYERFNARVNLSSKIKDWLTVSTSTLMSREHINDVTDNAGVARGGVVLSALTTPPTVPMYDAQGRIGQNPQTGWENPLGAIIGRDNKFLNDRIVSNVGFDFNLLKGLVVQSRFGLDYKNNDNKGSTDPIYTQAGRNARGSLSERLSKELVWLSEQTITFTQNWNKHNFSALGGWSVQDSHYEETYLTASVIDSQYRFSDWSRRYALAQNKTTAPARTIKEWGLMSYFARFSYDYAGKYLFQANMRVDQSSKFAPGNRTAAFPSFSAGWRISDEAFMKNVRAVNDLKLRASWGKNGNQEGIDSYDYLSLNKIDPTTGAVDINTIAPQTLTWEKTTQTNIGIDATFLNRRLTFTADFYVKNTKDVLVKVPVSGQIVSSLLLNSGSMRNIGQEFMLSSRNIVKKDLTWTTDFNIAFNQNKVLKIADGIGELTAFGEIYEKGNAIVLKEGYGLGQFIGYVAAGVDPATGLQLYQAGDGSKVTEPKPSDRRLIGSAQPKFVYGMTNAVSYKNFDLSVFIQGSQGNKIYNGVRVETEGMKDSRNQSTAILSRWRKPGDVTNMPGVLAGSDNNALISTRFLENGSYLRFRTITLSYRLGESLIERIGFRSASIYVSAQNLFTITKYTGFDPEVNSYGSSNNTQDNRNVSLGIDYGAYPQAKIFLVGLNIGL
ncbi:SusC/RagA family TonB-linked outer membrane protein [Filimonas effusa]|uniref:TonB-dependent receptor n=1 Tax=Filimonas effusa TaxID=2508721 RepID=A0A4Q1DAC3_9BACT|nr:TonB-dependent receptor [Filimonas effusa]RXK85429.1 TonB-dependent receptor [Filimonas effusa]